MRVDHVPREVLLVVALVAIGWAVALSVQGWAARLRVRRRFSRGSAGEREGAALLEAHGFTIEGAQVGATYDLQVDGAPVSVNVRADYIVSRRGERFVAEVKTGRTAPRIDTPATRRQLLEYQHAFGVTGVLLVDADAGRVHAVTFIDRPPRPSPARAIALVCALAAALAVTFALR